ncbi:MAG: glycogen debranching N-terminal domain-containing protein [Planctomycetota bacterium]
MGPREFSILAHQAPVDDRTRVLKQGETFGVFDRWGDFFSPDETDHGLYHRGTRFLSRFRLLVGGRRPLLLSSSIQEDNGLLTVDMANPEIPETDPPVTQETVHLFRSQFLWDGALYGRIELQNFGEETIRLPLSFHFQADFRDLFEVRGTQRSRRGVLQPPTAGGNQAVLAYEGLDSLRRETALHFDPAPASLESNEARFLVELAPRTRPRIEYRISCSLAEEVPARPKRPLQAAAARKLASHDLQETRTSCSRIETSNEQFNDWINRSSADLSMMITRTPTGPFVYAGVPWYSTPFGRDALVTALETVWVHPALAAGVLRFLAANQAVETDPLQEAEPGKILHEFREGEMANLGEIPFRRYYGSVDATPLFVWLAGESFRMTSDEALLEEIWPAVERALGWMEAKTASSANGWLTYEARNPEGLVHQGWKDSSDSVFHADGSLAPPPIALCEVQGYLHAALKAGARMAGHLGLEDRRRALKEQAARLRERFDRGFWDEELGTYALALDGEGKPCRVKTSNAGHALFSGIARRERAPRLARTLFERDSFTGWGIRTVQSRESRYNPMSYHNGSVWPHDNALVAQGLARYGFKEEAIRLLAGLLDASTFLELHRLPELFCGFPRRPKEGPTLYPVACIPQSWSSGAPILLLQACLGLQIDAEKRRILFDHPILPPFLEEVRLFDLQVGAARIDLELHRHPEDVGIHVLKREGEVEVAASK